MSSRTSSREVIHRARALLAEGRALLETDDAGVQSPSGLLGLYEALCARLDRVDDDDIGELLAALSDTVDELAQLAEDLERVKRLRAALVAPMSG